ncbi:hypothetical protein JTY60_01235 [symbiont of Argiope bruennichi]|uniref:hypothetical protein n=1 Tax=symbiont of Argiope bruennichi TaxID=2810479 RepID=UPI003DA291D1
MLKILKFFKKIFFITSIFCFLFLILFVVLALYHVINNFINNKANFNNKEFIAIVISFLLFFILSLVSQKIINKIIVKITKKTITYLDFNSEAFFLKNSPFTPQSFENDKTCMKEDFLNICNILDQNKNIFFLSHKRSGTTTFFRLIEKQKIETYQFYYLDFKLVSIDDKILIIFYFLQKILPEKSFQKVARIGNLISETFLNLIITNLLKSDKSKILSTDTFNFSDEKISLLNNLKTYLKKNHNLLFNKSSQKKVCFLIDNLDFITAKQLILEINFVFSDFCDKYFFIFQSNRETINNTSETFLDFCYFLKKNNFLLYEPQFTTKEKKQLYVKTTLKEYTNKSKKNINFSNLKKFKEDLILSSEKLSFSEINEKILNFFS